MYNQSPGITPPEKPRLAESFGDRTRGQPARLCGEHSGGVMSAEALLSSLVEVAAGIAGIAGIVATVCPGRTARWPHEPRIPLEILLTASAFAIVFALRFAARAPWTCLRRARCHIR